MDRKKTVFWLTTAPNPHSPATGFDAGQRGWRTHAVVTEPEEKFKDVKSRRSLCGLRPAHGWGMDLFIEQKCKRCEAKVKAGDFEER